MDKNKKDFVRIGPGVYLVNTSEGLSTAPAHWNYHDNKRDDITGSSVGQRWETPKPTQFPVLLQYTLDKKTQTVVIRQLDGTQSDPPVSTDQQIQDVVQLLKAPTWFSLLPNPDQWVARINHPLVQDVITDPVLLNQAANFIDSCAPATDIAGQLRALARALNDGKPYAKCFNGDCVWSGHIEADEDADYVGCPECGKLADIKR